MRVKWETVWNPQQTYLKRVAVLAFWLFIWLPFLFPAGAFLGLFIGVLLGIDLMVRWATDDPNLKAQAAEVRNMLAEYFLDIVVPCR